MPFEIVRNDIANISADAVVNTANPEPIVGAGVDGALHRKAGRQLLEARREIGAIAVGDAALTPAFRLNARYVIHTVAPVWEGGERGEAQLLASCYKKSLELAKSRFCESVAFPLIAAGTYGFPKALALRIAVREITAFLTENDMHVFLVVYDKDSFVLSEKLFKSVSSYIDENYIESNALRSYGAFNMLGAAADKRRKADAALRRSACEDAAMAEPIRECSEAFAGAGIPTASDDWGRLLKNLDAGFSETLLRLIDRTGKKDSEIYKRANVDRKLFSKIRNNPDYKPSKTTALAFAFALELDINETKDFIGRAGFALSHSSKFDVIVECFLVNGNYDVFELNEVLFAFDQPLIGA